MSIKTVGDRCKFCGGRGGLFNRYGECYATCVECNGTGLNPEALARRSAETEPREDGDGE